MKKEERDRIERMLEQDKEELNEPSRLAAVKDFTRVTDEYFEREGEPHLKLERDKRGFTVTLMFRARRVKNFSVLK